MVHVYTQIQLNKIIRSFFKTSSDYWQKYLCIEIFLSILEISSVENGSYVIWKWNGCKIVRRIKYVTPCVRERLSYFKKGAFCLGLYQI